MFELGCDIVTILSDLISIESETGNEKALCDKLFDTLKSYDGELIRVKNSLLFNLDLKKDKRVALIGHIDTVPVANSSTTPEIKDDELWGRGSCDMKSGLAVMLKVIDDISIGKIKPKQNLSFVFYENEEGALPNGINFLLDNNYLMDIDFAFVLEPTQSKYSVGCLGSLAVKKDVYGISAHSANPKKGKNALIEATEIVMSVEKMNKLINKDSSIDGLDYYETVNITQLGTTTETFNVIPDHVEIVANFRFSPKRSSNEALEYLLEFLGQDNITILDKADSCYIGDSGNDFLLPNIDREIMQAWTDIAQLNKAGIPSINYGAGSIKYAHKPDERISIDELTEFYKSLVTHL
ncbi:M20/M25/M40 family metallo-hydrolase [Thiospirochaeta perfilievii]|uniref:M20/M25/M40 family metallo-hydrolase n=1 Tax=Thiospirochaeta perfilievii TaxID=252967 RepID=UPI001658E142|nr:M20/M25/M40 family metallo-hydrolase [Thiospirochaeta perfilievii]